VDEEHRANFPRWVKKLFRSCECLDGRRGALPSSHFGKPGKVDCGRAEAHAQLGYGTYRFQVRDVLSSRTFCSSNAHHLGRRWHREQPARGWTLSWGRWGYLDNDNVHYVVPALLTFQLTLLPFGCRLGVYKHSFRGKTGASDVFVPTVAGASNTDAGRVMTQQVFTSVRPLPGGESVRIALVCISSRPNTPEKTKMRS